MKKFFSALICLLFSVTMLLSFTACGKDNGEANKKMGGGVVRLNALSSVTASAEEIENPAYRAAYQDFAFRFLKTVQNAEGDKNLCLSPFSAYMAFSLCFAGSYGDTAKEFETVFSLSKEDATRFSHAMYGKFLQRELYDKQTKIGLANSVWIDENYSKFVKQDYLNTATEEFHAEVFSGDFTSPSTVRKLNQWCSDKTDGLIQKIIDDFGKDEFMALVNALLVEAAWQTEYKSYEVGKYEFTNLNSSKTPVEFLCRNISSCYLSDDAKAFSMPLKDGFSFVGILPEEGIPFEDFVKNLTGEKVQALLENPTYEYSVNTRIPKFKLDYSLDLEKSMREMGMIDAFDGARANFKKMAEIPNYNVAIGRAIQKTHFELDENGIKAAAVTYIGMGKATAMPPEEKKEIDIFLNRPFVYLLVDSQTSLPLFVGTVNSL